MTLPLVSICMPCYNSAEFLSASLDSALAQTYRPIEIIAINDGSQDQTGEILDHYAKAHGVRVFHQKNQGQSATENRAFSESQGEFIKFFDADDLMSPDLVELQVQRLRESPGCVASSQWGRFHSNPAEAVFTEEPVWKDLAPMDWLVESMWNRQNMMQCGIWLFPRDVVERSGGWDSRLSLINDVDFIPRALLQSQGIRFTTGRLYYRSGLTQSLSGRKSRKAYESATLAVEKFAETLISHEDSFRTRKVCADLLQIYYYEIAPHHKDLGERLKSRIKDLGGSDAQPIGGPIFQLLSKVIGWNATSRLRTRAYSLNYAALRARLRNLMGRHSSRLPESNRETLTDGGVR